MNKLYFGLTVVAALGLQACATPSAEKPMMAEKPAMAAEKPAMAAEKPAMAASFVLASYAMGKKTSDQGAMPIKVSYSERPGDAVLNSVDVVGGAATLNGVLSTSKGSSWAGLAMIFPYAEGAPAQDLSAFKTLKIRLASPSVSSLRIRVAGDDKKTQDSGCYPVFFLQGVKAEMTEFNLPLANFAPEGWCGPNGIKIAPTLKAVSGVEVADTKQSNKPTEIKVQLIEFLK